jgi:hypothetical protein
VAVQRVRRALEALQDQPARAGSAAVILAAAVLLGCGERLGGGVVLEKLEDG